MERYYKTNRDSETGLKLKAILDKADKFNKHVEKLRKKYGFTETWHSTFFYKDLSAVTFEKEPDMTIWKRMKDVHSNSYYPRTKCKDKSVLADFKELSKLSIRRDELDEIVGNNDVFCQAGFNFNASGIYIFIVENDWGCDIPKDCQEISNIEYEQLTSKKE